jgi:hypothetical protein
MKESDLILLYEFLNSTVLTYEIYPADI